MIHFDIVTIFPEMFSGVLSSSMLKIAAEKGKISVNLINPRDYTTDKHRSVDDAPYGGGSGMVMAAEPLARTVMALKRSSGSRVVNFSARGKRLDHGILKQFHEDNNEHYILICGHYEGIDERFIEKYVDIELSIGDYVLTGGELPALVFMDSLSRLIPGVLGNEESLKEESFSGGLLEYPQYTRPEVFEGLKVPGVLVSGHHGKVAGWRLYRALWETFTKRKDLFDRFEALLGKGAKTEKKFIGAIRRRAISRKRLQPGR